ncbi:NAD-dependent DNA ligase subunit A [Salmonella phage SP-3]|uniref:NAD-dependent DNA ligase subunit A n=1 Tax=Salmonella phage SP-3 TaxID=1186124 RepID=A0A2H4PIP2_9CAUD|nr:NAD-dependent DNA ligase subunit A [Salmonella phage SP3]ATW62636.1 NAD-dependent DNA ligase subunit A [Salmonella phage SP3]
MNSGIYLLKVKEYKYVGYSRNIDRRFKEHTYTYVTNLDHIDSHIPRNLLGGQVQKSDISIEILEYISPEENTDVFLRAEDLWIQKICPELNTNSPLSNLAEAVEYCILNPFETYKSVASKFNITSKMLEHVATGGYNTLECILLKSTLELFRSKKYKELVLVHENGARFVATSYSELHRLSGLDRHRISDLHKGKYPSFKGWALLTPSTISEL